MNKFSWRAGLILALLALLPHTNSAVEPSSQELAQAWDWQRTSFALPRSNGKIPPISFSYEGRPAAQLLREWKCDVGAEARVGDKINRSLLYTDPASGLELTLELTSYRDFPAVEWVIRFRNKGNSPTPILENIQPLDFSVDCRECEFVVHYAQGANNLPTDFSPVEHILKAGVPLEITSVGGSSSHTRAVPFFNVQRMAGREKAGNKEERPGGILVGLGWTGQWSAVFDADSQSLRARAGMERTHLRLLPGESIRTPRILLFFWQGEDRIRSHNLLRKFLLAHHTPRPGGQLPKVPIAAMPWWQFDYGNRATAENQIETASLYRKRQLPVDTYWLDAGWFEGGWPNGTGNWFPKKEAFPQGLRPLADAVHGLGMRLVVWFRPEKVSPGTWLDSNHPEWLLGPGQQKLLNLGNLDARTWLTEHISNLIQTEGIDIYRHDLSLDPLQYWRDADAPDRQGMTEILYIQGLYEYWDGLIKRNPGLLIDNAASGGRRIDLETLSRSLPLWRFDYFGGEMTAFQAHGAGLALYVPLSSTGVPPTKNNPNVEAPDIYIARSAMSSGLPLTWDLHHPDFDESLARRIVNEIRDVSRFYEGDFYPLTEITPEAQKWLAFQYDRPELGEGMLLAFRRPKAQGESLSVKFHGLSSEAKYEVTDMDTRLKRIVTGQELSQGFRLKVASAPDQACWFTSVRDDHQIGKPPALPGDSRRLTALVIVVRLALGLMAEGAPPLT